MSSVIHVGQGIAKDCIVGDRYMNRYGIFNGLERPRRIDSNLSVQILGFDLPTIVSVTSVATAGNLENAKWYAYRAVYASEQHTRPVAATDGSQNYTRGNGSTVLAQQSGFAASSMNVVVAGSANAGVSHILLYRSLGAATQAEAEAGPFYYVTKAGNVAGNVTINDGTNDNSVGLEIEADNYPPNAYRYAVSAFGYIFAGGNYVLGADSYCTVTTGSPTVTLTRPIAFDGVRGWCFKCTNEVVGGVNNGGLFYANYVNPLTLTLVDALGAPLNYNGILNGAGQAFSLYLPGYVLRWCKEAEPEAWPLENVVNFEGDITGLALLPNQPLLIVCTDTPAMWAFDLTLLGTYNFKTNKRLLSSEMTASSHYSLVGVGRRLRGIDAHRGCIWESDGVSVADITKETVKDVFDWLDNDGGRIKNWHAAYDPRQNLYGAFVGFRYSHRVADFCIGQNISTGGWFYHWEKDLLCTGQYIDPDTSESMTLGGTEGFHSGGAVWGRIWCPDCYDEWIPAGTLRSGYVVSATPTSLTVDNTGGDLYTASGGLSGRWVMVCDGNGENAQLGYILGNTANVITIDTCVNGTDATQWTPLPQAGWKFFLGLIEIRWGPKRMDMGDPDALKHVEEVRAVVSEYDNTNLPFIRTFQGMDNEYDKQRVLQEWMKRDGVSANDCLYSRAETHGEPSPRWGFELRDRSYSAFRFRSFTVVFHPAGAVISK